MCTSSNFAVTMPATLDPFYSGSNISHASAEKLSHRDYQTRAFPRTSNVSGAEHVGDDALQKKTEARGFASKGLRTASCRPSSTFRMAPCTSMGAHNVLLDDSFRASTENVLVRKSGEGEESYANSGNKNKI